MAQVSIKDAKNRLTELARRVEAGALVTVTRNGKPILDLVPHKPKGGIDWGKASVAGWRSMGSPTRSPTSLRISTTPFRRTSC